MDKTGGGADNTSPLVLVYLPEDPEEALVALGLIGIWKDQHPELVFDALCVASVKPLARCCKSLRLVISFIENDQPFRRDFQQGGQLSAFDYKCAMVLTRRFHPQLTLRLSRVTWRIGWKNILSPLLLTSALSPGDWQGVWQHFTPALDFPDPLPAAKLGKDSSESHNALLDLGLNKNNTLMIATQQPLSAPWKEALRNVRQEGAQLLCCGPNALQDKEQGCYDAALATPYQQYALAALPAMAMLLGSNQAHRMLARSFALPYVDITYPPEPGWSNRIFTASNKYQHKKPINGK